MKSRSTAVASACIHTNKLVARRFASGTLARSIVSFIPSSGYDILAIEFFNVNELLEGDSTTQSSSCGREKCTVPVLVSGDFSTARCCTCVKLAVSSCVFASSVHTVASTAHAGPGATLAAVASSAIAAAFVTDPRPSIPARVLLRIIGVWNLWMFGFFTATLLVVAAVLQGVTLPFDSQRRVSASLTRWLWGRAMIGAHWPFWRVTTTGLERLGKGPWILAANHQSMLDIPLVTRLPVPVRVLARPGVFRMPVFGTMARVGRHINLDPTSRETLEEAMRGARSASTEGASVLVFPEGTRGDGDVLQPFNRGAFELAIQAGADVLPVAISGTRDALPKGTAFPIKVFCHFHLQLLEPVPVEGQSRRKVATRVRERIEAALAGPRPWEVCAAVKSAYLPLGRGRAGWAYGKTSFDPVFWALHERLPVQGRWLDVGCGEGLLAVYVRAAGHQLQASGLDPDAARVGQATTLLGAGFSVGDARTADLGAGWDVITCIDVLHYLSAEEQRLVLTRFVDALAPGGLLLLRDPDPSRGLAGALTVRAEQALVAGGRHVGDGVSAQGAAGLASLLREQLDGLKAEDCSAGTPFANVLISGRKPAG